MNRLTSWMIALKSLPGWGNKSCLKLLRSLPPAQPDLDSFYEAVVRLAATSKRFHSPSVREFAAAVAEAEAALEQAQAQGIVPLLWGDPDYPQRALNHDDAPLLIYVKGSVALLHQPQLLTVIGTRHPGEFAQKAVPRLVERAVALGYGVVSGLALGIDQQAHEATLRAGGHTAAILAHGLDTLYPKSNRALAEAMLEQNGCWVSEYPLGEPLREHQLVARDRLQALFADRLLLVESSHTGGSMHAAQMMVQKLQRPVGVVWGERLATQPSYSGNAALIEQGATPLHHRADLEQFLAPATPAPRYRTVLFDLDQTLVDSSSLMPLRDQGRWGEVWQRIGEAVPFTGVDELLQGLRQRGLQLGVVTSAPRRYCELICQRQQWRFDATICYHDTARHKPHPDPLLHAVAQLQTTTAQTLYIGDQPNDAQAAAAAGIGYLQFELGSGEADRPRNTHHFETLNQRLTAP